MASLLLLGLGLGCANFPIAQAQVFDRQAENATLPTHHYHGELVSMEFYDASVRSVLDVLADFAHINIVTSESVKGRVTLRLKDVPWDQALAMIVQSQNLSMQNHQGIIFIASADEVANLQTQNWQSQQALQNVQPLHTEYIRLKYAIAEDVFKLIQQSQKNQAQVARQSTPSPVVGTTVNATTVANTMSSPVTYIREQPVQSGIASNTQSTSLLSNRGTIAIDKRTNTLIIKDTEDSIANVRLLLEHIDIPVQQVMIEARIVSATDTFSKELGVSWGILSNRDDLLIAGSQQTLWDIRDANSSSSNTYDITRPDNLNVDLGLGNAAGRIAFGLLNLSDLMIDLELSAMQADGRGEVISTPKVLTADKQTAKVVSGTQIPYQEAAGDNTTATRFIEAALSLEVTPSITPDGKIGMQLHINNDSPRLLSSGVYAIDTNSIYTNVIVENGQTVVLGGVYRNATANGENKVPVLGDVPVLGHLFKQTVQSDQKEELLIFVTPKLVGDW